MKLTDYVWSRNPRGMHNKDIFDFGVDMGMYRRANVGWVKFVANEGEYLDEAQTFLNEGRTPVVRMYVPRWGNAPMPQRFRAIYREYARAGVKWFEMYNEPNLDIEWPIGTVPDWRNAEMIAPLMDNWLRWAEFIISLGCYPGFIALAESDDPQVSAVRWMDTMLNYLGNNHYDRFLNVLRGGCYCATHPYILNHWYQEARGPLSARPPGAVDASEGGWHFEYPYDPIQQANDPGRTVYGGTPRTPYGDPVGLIAMGRMFNERCARMFGTQAVPVVGTEGGIWDFPGPGDPPLQQDTRYPPYTNASQAEGTVAMFEWIARQGPPWFFGVTLWKEDVYQEKGGRAIARLEETPVVRKVVPELDVMGDGSGPPTPEVETVRGPGPIHGAADFHIVLLDRSLEPAWFFDTAEAYWGRFRPNVTTLTDFFGFIPSDKSLAITAILREERLPALDAIVASEYPNAYLDVLFADSMDDVQTELDRRAEIGLRFG